MEPKTTKRPSRKLVVFKRELPFYLMLIIFFPLPLTLPIPTFYFLIPNCSNFSPCFLTPNFSRRFPMAHTLLFSGYGAPGCDDLAVCRLTADGMLDCVYELDGHMRVLNHDGCTVSTVQASTVPKPRSWPGGACATADGTCLSATAGPTPSRRGSAAARPAISFANGPPAIGRGRCARCRAPCICWLPANERARCIVTIVHPCPTAPLPKPPALRCLVLPARWCWTDFCHCIFSFPHFLLVQAFLLCTITSYLHLSLWQSPYRKSGISLSLLFGMGFL